MRLQLVLLICVCLAALAVAKKGKKKGANKNVLKTKGQMCEDIHRSCMQVASSAESRSTCQNVLRRCKQQRKRRRGKKHGGGFKKRPSPKQHFCRCFKRLFGVIKKHHDKNVADSEGQRFTVHEKIFNIVDSTVKRKPGNPLLINGRLTKLESMKECLRQHYCHPRKQCNMKKGGKQRGKKPKRRNRGAEFLFGKFRRDKKKGQGKKEQKGPFFDCVSKAKKCKGRSGGVKKQMKGCAKVFFKCVQDECNKA